MRRAAAMLALAPLGGCAAHAPSTPVATARPMRVMSVNQCTDQLVLALLPPDRIASVSWLARDTTGSLMTRAAARVGSNHGLAEEVIAQKPDLVVTGHYTTPALRGMLGRLHYPMIEVDHANSFDDVRRITRQVADAVGARARGEALIARMDATLADLARDPGPPIRVVAWDQTGFSAGAGTLFDAVLGAAGARNVVREPMALSYRKPDVEVLLQAAPPLLVRGSRDARIAGLGDDVMRHRLVRRYWSGGRTLTIPQAYYTCGTPMIAEAAVALRRQLRQAASLAPTLPFRPEGLR